MHSQKNSRNIQNGLQNLPQKISVTASKKIKIPCAMYSVAIEPSNLQKTKTKQ